MKLFNIILLGLFIVFSAAAGGNSESPQDEISGEVDGGLRILRIEDSTENLEFTIYRGDYIVFDFEKAGNYEFTVSELEIDTVMPKPESEKPYVKMKESGDFSFMLDGRKGVFHVKELIDSNYTEVSAEEAANLIKNVEPFILDVRTSAEYNSGHLPGADLLPVQLLADNLDMLEKYRNEDILLYCASGNRSTVAARMLIDAGFTKVYNLRYGYGDWVRKGQPVE